MKPQARNDNPSSSTLQKPYTVGSVTSADGTHIGYRQYGHGPGLVLVQGGMGAAHHFHQFACALADMFTVYVPDRRGRGLSGPSSNDYPIQKDVEDITAVLTHTDAHNLFGLSTGGLIALQTALTQQALIHKAAFYEPGISTAPTDWVKRYDREMAEGKVADALITGMKGAKMAPPLINALPYFLMVPMTKKMLASEQDDGEYLPMKVLAPTLHHDGQMLIEMSGRLESFRTLQIPVLLLGGSKSAAFQKAALSALEKVLPHARRVEFKGLDHGSVWNYEKQRNPGGKPEVVAQELRRFFAEP